MDVLCQNSTAPTDDLVYATTLYLDANAHFNANVTYMVTLGFELYDLDSDPGEATDLALEDPERLNLMRDRLARELVSHQAQLSIDRISGLPVVLPAIIRSETQSVDES